MPSACSRSSIGVEPSTNHVPSSRGMIWSSSEVVTRSAITVDITSLIVMMPTTSAYSLRITAKSPCVRWKTSSTSESVSESGMNWQGCTRPVSRKLMGFSSRTQRRRCLESTKPTT